jgi:iron complex outermembrane receptor protein
MHIPTYFAILFLFICSTATAQIEDDLIGLYEEDELITIATGTAKEVRFAPSVATVITADDIKNTGARFLDDVLEMVPGMHVGRGSNRQNAIYSLRGIHTDENPQVLLLIDGIDTAQLFNSSRSYNYRLPVANISRIEIIRGPGSAVYGADAFSGVINVITKVPSDTGEKLLGGRSGSFDSDDLWFIGGTQLAGLNVDLAVEYSRSEGDDGRIVPVDAAFPSQPTFAPSALSTHYELFNSRLSIANDDWKLSLSSYNLVSAGLGSGGAEVLDPIGRDKANAFKIHYSQQFNESVDNWRFKLDISGGINDQNPRFVLWPSNTTLPFLPGAFPEGVIGQPSTEDTVYTVELASIFDGLESHSMRISVGYEYQNIKTAEVKNFDFSGGITAGTLTDVTGTDLIFLENQTREVHFVSLQDEWQLANDWALTFGLRFDDYNDFGSTVNPRLALVWAADYNLTMKALYGRAFRAPSFAELFAKNNPAILGNATLDPEVIDTFEISIEYDVTADLNTSLNIFYYEVEDLIDYPSFGQPAANLFAQYGHGLEWELNWAINSKWSTKTNMAWQHSAQAGVRVADAPNHQVYTMLTWQPDSDWTFNAVATRAFGRARAEGDSRDKIDDYSTVDFVAYNDNLIPNLQTSIVIKNALDRENFEPSASVSSLPGDYPLEGRSVRIEFTYSLN